MKKLMTVIAAVAMSFGLFAGTIDPIDSFDASAQGATLTDGRWKLDDVEITGDIDEAKIEDSLLKIASGSRTLTREFLADNASTNIPMDGLYFDINLQFLDPVDGTDALADMTDAKIAAAVIDNSGADFGASGLTPSTNLYVIGGYKDGDAWVKRAYMFANSDLSGTTANRLTVKMYNNVLASGKRPGSRFFVGGIDEALTVKYSFPILEDGTIDFANPEEADAYMGVAATDIAAAVRSRYTDKSLILSLAAGVGSDEVSAVDFVGQANIANFNLADKSDFIGPDVYSMSVGYDSEAVTIKSVSGAVGNPTFADDVITYDANETLLTVEAEYATGLAIVKWAINGQAVAADVPFAPVRNGTLAITAVAPAAYVITADGTKLPFENLFGTDETTDAEAYVKANGGTLQLTGDAVYPGECFVVGVGDTFTLDLAGHTFKSTGNQSSIEVFGTLTVTNSTEGTLGAILPPNEGDANAIHVRGGKAVVSDGRISGKIQTNDGGVELDITGGRIDAIIVQTGEMDRIQTTGGLFNQTVFREANAIPGVDYKTHKAVDNGDGYWKVRVANYIAQVVSTVADGVEETNACETVGEALQVVQAAEAAGKFPIVVTCLAEDGLTITNEGRTLKLVKDQAVSVISAGVWAIQGTMVYSGPIEGTVITDEIEIIGGGKIALGVHANVKVALDTKLTKASFIAPFGYKVVVDEEEEMEFVQFTVEALEIWKVTLQMADPTKVETFTANPTEVREDAEDKTVTLTAEFKEGYELDYFTVDGQKIEGDTFEITADVEVGVEAKASSDPIDDPTALDDNGRANLETLKAALDAAWSDIDTYAYAIYSSGKIPAEKLNATTADLIAISVKYNLPILGQEPTVAFTAGTTANAFEFKLMEGDVAVPLAQAHCMAKFQDMVEFTADLGTTPFAKSTSDDVVVAIKPEADNCTAVATFTKTTDAGFMRVNLKVPGKGE